MRPRQIELPGIQRDRTKMLSATGMLRKGVADPRMTDGNDVTPAIQDLTSSRPPYGKRSLHRGADLPNDPLVLPIARNPQGPGGRRTIRQVSIAQVTAEEVAIGVGVNDLPVLRDRHSRPGWRVPVAPSEDGRAVHPCSTGNLVIAKPRLGQCLYQEKILDRPGHIRTDVRKPVRRNFTRSRAGFRWFWSRWRMPAD